MILFRNLLLLFIPIFVWACIEVLTSEEETFDCECGVKKVFNGGIFGHHKDNVDTYFNN